jgi:hypothetical protein
MFSSLLIKADISNEGDAIQQAFGILLVVLWIVGILSSTTVVGFAAGSAAMLKTASIRSACVLRKHLFLHKQISLLIRASIAAMR